MDNKFESKIYVVDDDPFCLATYDKHLKALGYQSVTCFSSGDSFLEKLTDVPDIVLLDHDLGDITGLEVLSRVKQFNNNIFVIFASGQQQKTVAAASLKGGAFDYVVKDADLLENITSALDKLFIMKDYLRGKNRHNRFFPPLSLLSAVMILASFCYGTFR